MVTVYKVLSKVLKFIVTLLGWFHGHFKMFIMFDRFLISFFIILTSHELNWTLSPLFIKLNKFYTDGNLYLSGRFISETKDLSELKIWDFPENWGLKVQWLIVGLNIWNIRLSDGSDPITMIDD